MKRVRRIEPIHPAKKTVQYDKNKDKPLFSEYLEQEIKKLKGREVDRPPN